MDHEVSRVNGLARWRFAHTKRGRWISAFGDAMWCMLKFLGRGFDNARTAMLIHRAGLLFVVSLGGMFSFGSR